MDRLNITNDGLSLLGKTKKRLLLRFVLIESLDGLLVINNLIEYQDNVLYTLLIQFAHIAIHVWEKDSRGNYSIHKANLHISARTNLAGSICWYVHDTVNNTSKTNCHPLLAITEAKEAMQEEVKAQLNKATNWEVAVTVGVVVAIVVIAWATWPASAIALVAAARSAGDQPEGNSEQPPIDTGSDELSAPPNEKAQEPDESKKAPGVPVESETVPGIPPNEDIPENE